MTRPSASADQVGAAPAAEQVGQRVQGGAALVVAVGRVVHDLGVGAEGRVVDERPAVDVAEVDPRLHPVAQRVEAAGRVLPVQPEVESEVVAGAGADHQERHVVLGGDLRDERLGAVAARDTEQVRPRGERVAGELLHVGVRTVEQRHLRAQRLGPLLQPEPGDLAASRAGVHDEERPQGVGGVDDRQRPGGAIRAQRGARGQRRRRPAARGRPGPPTAAARRRTRRAPPAARRLPRASATQRSTPRCCRNQKPAAITTTTAPAVSSSSQMPRRPAKGPARRQREHGQAEGGPCRPAPSIAASPWRTSPADARGPRMVPLGGGSLITLEGRFRPTGHAVESSRADHGGHPSEVRCRPGCRG